MTVVSCVRTYVFRYPLEHPVVTSFGAMHDRPAVLVRVEDSDGAYGWGEIWCNFPSCGAEHRARLADAVLAPRLIGREVRDIGATFEDMERSLRILALQAGEAGPLAQAAAGIDIALWDLAARKSGVPVRKLLKAAAGHKVPTYASGIHPDMLDEMVNIQRAAGYRSYKLKVGFGLKKDIAAVRQLKDMLRDGERMMLDANQAWDISKAGEIIPHFAEYAPDWLEEPLAADCPWDEWSSLSQISAIPIAAGENLRGHVDFGAAVDCGALRVIQPDMCKWGGFSGCYAVANRIVQSGLVYCPHYLGAGIGLMASAQLLAAVGGSGRLEIDSNANPLRELLARPLPQVSAGFMTLPDAAGLGVEPDLDAAREWLAYSTVAA